MFWDATPAEVHDLRRRPVEGVAAQPRLRRRPDALRPADRQAGRDGRRLRRVVGPRRSRTTPAARRCSAGTATCCGDAMEARGLHRLRGGVVALRLQGLGEVPDRQPDVRVASREHHGARGPGRILSPADRVRAPRRDDPDARRRQAAHRDLHAEERRGPAADHPDPHARTASPTMPRACAATSRAPTASSPTTATSSCSRTSAAAVKSEGRFVMLRPPRDPKDPRPSTRAPTPTTPSTGC